MQNSCYLFIPSEVAKHNTTPEFMWKLTTFSFSNGLRKSLKERNTLLILCSLHFQSSSMCFSLEQPFTLYKWVGCSYLEGSQHSSAPTTSQDLSADSKSEESKTATLPTLLILELFCCFTRSKEITKEAFMLLGNAMFSFSFIKS